MSREINRDEWRGLCERIAGEPTNDAHTTVDVNPGRVTVEFEEGVSQTAIYYTRQATDVRVGDVQLLVGRDRLVILRSHPPYPINRWTVIYDGGLPK